MLVDPFEEPDLSFMSLNTPAPILNVVTPIAQDPFSRLPAEILRHIAFFAVDHSFVLHEGVSVTPNTESHHTTSASSHAPPQNLASGSSNPGSKWIPSSQKPESKPDKYIVNPHYTIHFLRHASPSVFRASPDFGTAFWFRVIENEVLPFVRASLASKIETDRLSALKNTSSLSEQKDQETAKMDIADVDGMGMYRVWLTLRCRMGLRNRRRMLRFIVGIFGLGDSIVEVASEKDSAK